MNGLVTKEFEQQAIAFGQRVETALVEVQSVEEAKGMLDKGVAMQAYAEQLKAGIDVAKPIAAGVLKIKIKIGELMPSQQGKRTEKLPVGSAGSLEFASHTIAAYRKMAENRERLEEYLEKNDDVPSQSGFIQYAKNGGHVKHNSGQNEWYTPPQYVLLARSVMGGIDLDPASSEFAQKTVQAETYYTKDDDGLAKDWSGRVWMNPPYAGNLIGQFANKLADHVSFGDVSQAVMLVNNATDTKWFQSSVAEASAICLCSGRIKFLDATGVEANTPLQGQAFVYFGKRSKRFCDAFRGTRQVFEVAK